jgi:hypothetical protein
MTITAATAGCRCGSLYDLGLKRKWLPPNPNDSSSQRRARCWSAWQKSRSPCRGRANAENTDGGYALLLQSRCALAYDDRTRHRSGRLPYLQNSSGICAAWWKSVTPPWLSCTDYYAEQSCAAGARSGRQAIPPMHAYLANRLSFTNLVAPPPGVIRAHLQIRLGMRERRPRSRIPQLNLTRILRPRNPRHDANQG